MEGSVRMRYLWKGHTMCRHKQLLNDKIQGVPAMFALSRLWHFKKQDNTVSKSLSCKFSLTHNHGIEMVEDIARLEGRISTALKATAS